MSKQFKQIKNHCNRYAKYVSNISNNIENTTYCKSYFINNDFYDINYIQNCTDDIILHNFSKVRFECIHKNKDNISSGIFISVIMWLFISILCLMNSPESKYKKY
jgi:hypothetical protein